MSYSDPARVWEFYLDRVNRTIKTFADLNQLCEDAIKAMLLVHNKLYETLKCRGKKLPPQQAFVSLYYWRNIIYLQSAHALTCMGFTDPSMNLQRTVYETVLRGYFFIVKEDEAERYYQALQTEEELSYLRWLGPSFLQRNLYALKTRSQHNKLYKEICITAHADIRGIGLDFPLYHERRVADRLKFVLSLTYGNLQMVSECFLPARPFFKPTYVFRRY